MASRDASRCLTKLSPESLTNKVKSFFPQKKKPFSDSYLSSLNAKIASGSNKTASTAASRLTSATVFTSLHSLLLLLWFLKPAGSGGFLLFDDES